MSAVETGSQSHYFQVNPLALLPYPRASNSILTEQRGKWLIRVSDATCCSIWGVAFFGSELLFFLFSTSVFSETADWCLSRWTKKCSHITALKHTETYFNTCFGVDTFAVLISTRRWGLCIDALLIISVHFPPLLRFIHSSAGKPASTSTIMRFSCRILLVQMRTVTLDSPVAWIWKAFLLRRGPLHYPNQLNKARAEMCVILAKQLLSS